MTVTYLDVTERGEALISDLSQVESLLSVGAEYESRQLFTLKFRGGSHVVSAGKYIGIVPITKNFALRINSKISTGRLLRILEMADESPIFLELMGRQYEPGREMDVMELMIRALHRESEVLFRHGPLRAYVSRSEVGQHPRGRSNISQTITKLWPRGHFDRMTFDFFDYSPNIPLNQAMEHTFWYAIQMYPSVSRDPNPRVLQDLIDAHRMFAAVAVDRSRRFLPGLGEHLRVPPTSEPLASFTRLLTVCRVILEGFGIDVEEQPKEFIELAPLVIDMETVFQKFLHRTLSVRASVSDRLLCWDTAREHQKPLYKKSMLPIPAEFETRLSLQAAQPDFTIAFDQIPVIIGDAKYKSHRPVTDVYQVAAHAVAYGARDVMLVYPASTASEEISFRSLGDVGDIRIFDCSFPLDADDLDAVCDALFEALRRIVSTRQGPQSAQ